MALPDVGSGPGVGIGDRIVAPISEPDRREQLLHGEVDEVAQLLTGEGIAITPVLVLFSLEKFS